MAQLVKLADYVSRYEIDIYRYPSRYVRLKKERWQRIKADWEATRREGEGPLFQHYEEKGTWKKARMLLAKNWKKKTQEEMDLPSNWELRHQSVDALREQFVKELLSFQLNWASSTVSEISAIAPVHRNDPLLNWFLTSFPDTFFLFYEPVLMAGQAPVECDTLLLTPNELWVLHVLPGDGTTIYSSQGTRYWEKREGESRETLLHPSVSIRRTVTVLQQILQGSGIKLKTAVLCPDGYIDTGKNNRLEFYDKRSMSLFQNSLRKMTTPIKADQLKAAEQLLDAGLTVSENRMDAEPENGVDSEEEFR
ncbi:hypothetical protein [Alkalicoccus luteus]|uniref:hypothetical protein n=1 Tax=Alkalicoccus luteus TaxID=1237094 RepID=UPI004034AE8C